MQYISHLSDGAMRDALSILDQCSAFYFNETITVDKVREIVGSVDSRVFYILTEALYNSDSNKCLSIIDEVVMNGRDINQFVSEFIAHLRNLIVSTSIGDSSLSLDILADNIKLLREQALKIDCASLLSYVNTFSLLQNQIKYSTNERILLEVTCIRLCNPITEGESVSAETNIGSRLQRLEDIVFTNGKNIMPPAISEIDARTHKENIKPLAKAIPDDIKRVKSEWKSFISTFPSSAKSFLTNTYIGYLENNRICIISSDACRDYILKYETKIKEELEKRYERDFDIDFMLETEYDKRHRKNYGVPDESDEITELKRGFTDKGIVDIIYEK